MTGSKTVLLLGLGLVGAPPHRNRPNSRHGQLESQYDATVSDLQYGWESTGNLTLA